MTNIHLVITTTDNLETAEKIASTIVESGLSRCAQYDKVQSIYSWQGNIQKAGEYRLHIKAVSSNIDAIKNTILRLHNYALPEIVVINIDDGHQPYLDWLKELR